MIDEVPQSGDRPDGPANESPTDAGGAEENLSGRLMYLFVLLRVGDARLRHGRGRGASVLQGQGRVLRLLSLHSPISQSELAYLLGMRSQSLGELLGKLEAAGHIKRAPDAEDRRTYVVEITDAGRAAADKLEALQDDPFDVLDVDERRQFAAMLDRVIATVEERMPGGPDQRLRRMRGYWFGEGGRGDAEFERFHRGRGGRPFRGGWFAPGFGPQRAW